VLVASRARSKAPVYVGTVIVMDPSKVIHHTPRIRPVNIPKGARLMVHIRLGLITVFGKAQDAYLITDPHSTLADRLVLA
jgi:hypothetical protein